MVKNVELNRTYHLYNQVKRSVEDKVYKVCVSSNSTCLPRSMQFVLKKLCWTRISAKISRTGVKVWLEILYTSYSHEHNSQWNVKSRLKYVITQVLRYVWNTVWPAGISDSVSVYERHVSLKFKVSSTLWKYVKHEFAKNYHRSGIFYQVNYCHVRPKLKKYPSHKSK